MLDVETANKFNISTQNVTTRSKKNAGSKLPASLVLNNIGVFYSPCWSVWPRVTLPLCLDLQEDISGPEQGQMHTDWLTLNVGGRCFTTTR